MAKFVFGVILMVLIAVAASWILDYFQIWKWFK